MRELIRSTADLAVDFSIDVRRGWPWFAGAAILAALMTLLFAGLERLSGGVTPDQATGVSGFLVLIVAVGLLMSLTSAVLMTGALRAAIRRRYEGWVADPFRSDVVRQFLLGICIGTIMQAVGLTMMLLSLAAIGTLGDLLPTAGLGALRLAGMEEGTGRQIVTAATSVIAALTGGFVAARFLPALAASVAARRFVTFQVWTWTKGRWLPGCVMMTLLGVLPGLAGILAQAVQDDVTPLLRTALLGFAWIASFMAQVLLGAAIWRRVAPEDALAEAAWRPDGEMARIIPTAAGV